MKRLAWTIALGAATAVSLQAKLTVLATIPDLASIAKEIGRERIACSSIIVGARDAHRIEAKPSFMSRAASADLFLAVGLDYEIGFEGPILEGSRNARIQPGKPGYVRIGDWVKVRDVPAGRVSRADGDIHPYGNPHVWLDPMNGRIVAIRLAERMGSIDKANASFYKSNADSFVRRLDEAMFGKEAVAKFGGESLWQWDTDLVLVRTLSERGALGLLGGWCGRMRPFWGSPIVTYHRSWNYFGYRFGLKVVDELEPKPGLDPTPGHVAHVIEVVREKKVKVILQERFYSTRNADFVAQRTGATVVVAPASVGHEPAASDYIALFDTIVGRIVAALGK